MIGDDATVHARQPWLEVLKADHRAIFTAASRAQRASDFINNGLQPVSAG